jgi:hypothetical protein
MTQTIEIPKWFDGQIYAEGGKATNEFSGASCQLNNVELSIYDFIMGANMLIEFGTPKKEIVTLFRKSLDWFRKTNPEAYMILLD